MKKYLKVCLQEDKKFKVEFLLLYYVPTPIRSTKAARVYFQETFADIGVDHISRASIVQLDGSDKS